MLDVTNERGCKKAGGVWEEEGMYCDLSGANLNHAILDGADLSYTSLYGANLLDAYMSRVNLKDVDLSNTVLSNAKFRNADLYNAHLDEADNLDKARLPYGWKEALKKAGLIR